MDIYGTTVTVVQQVYQVTMFIKGIVSDVEMYDQDRNDIQLKLEIQLVFWESFQKLFLDNEHGTALMLPGHLSPTTSNTILRLLRRLKSSLADYEVIASKHGLNSSESDADKDGDVPIQAGQQAKTSFLNRVKTRVKDIKTKGWDWSLFDKEKLNEVMKEYKEWSDSLRDLMQHFLQVEATSVKLTPAVVDSAARGMGLQSVMQRKLLVSEEPPASFHELEGEIIGEYSSSRKGPHLAMWRHRGEEMQVVVENHKYDRLLRTEDLEPDEIRELKAPIRKLAWLLQNSAFPEGEESTIRNDQPAIYSLQCLGFIDQPLEERSVFIYRLPTIESRGGENLFTLHDMINTIDPRTKRPARPPLGKRFILAHGLAITLFNIHGSGWVHKNIWSRGILLFPKKRQQTDEPLAIEQLSLEEHRQKSLLPYLGDWGYARPTQAGTELAGDFEVEPNLYRHPERQGKPTHQFTQLHDMYALGVVLLEIGMWRTLSQLYQLKIREAERDGKPVRAREVRNGLINLARGELGREMGEEYAAAVVRCLSGKFIKDSQVNTSLDFKENVVDVLERGVRL